MGDKSHKQKLLLTSGLMTLCMTCSVLLFVLRPTTGWFPLLENQWNVWKPHILQEIHFLSSKKAVNGKEEDSQSLTYSIDAQLDTQHFEIKGHAAITLPPGTYKSIPFYLYPLSNQPMRIETVEWNQKPVPFQANPNQLTVEFPSQVKGTPTVDIRFVTPIPQAGTRLGEVNGVWSLDYWYPIVAIQKEGQWLEKPAPKGFGDPFLMDLADYSVRLRYPKGFSWFASGPLTQETPYGDQVVSEWRVNSIRNFSLIGSPSFVKKQWTTPDGVEVSVVSQSDQHLDSLMATVQDAINTYSQRFGTLAYPVLSVIEMPPGTVFAHEYPNLALFSQSIEDWPTGERWIAHEIAHAWWFSSVGTYKALNPWLDEGLTDYSARLYFEDRYGNERYLDEIKHDWSLFVEQRGYSPRDQGRYIGPVAQHTDQPYSAFTEEGSYYYLEYLRPVLMYHDLRIRMGDEKFAAFLKQFYIKNRWHTVTRTDLEQALKDVAPDQLERLRLWLDSPNQELIQQVKGDFTF